MGLDTKNTDRSYLWGRMMAIHEYTESLADSNGTRVLQLQPKYLAHPMTTFVKIESEIMPELYGKLSSDDYDRVMDLKGQLVAALSDNGGYTDEPLSEMYLMGYYLERPAMECKA